MSTASTTLRRCLTFFIPLLLCLSRLSFAQLPFDEWQHGRVYLGNVSIHFRYAGVGPPVVLVHGNPQHSLTWHTIGPVLSQNYTVICPDNRGAGDSSIPANDDYTASTQAEDIRGLLDFLHIDRTYIFSHDKGVGFATAFTAKYPSRVARLGVAEYPLPGFGYESAWTPNGNWSLYQNWQLAFFSVVDAAEYFIRDREKQMLSWYFFHSSYSGTAAISEEHLNRYTSQISKPGFLRAMFGPFSVGTVMNDAAFFNATVGQKKLGMPVLALGGEASFAPVGFVQQLFGPIASNLTAELVPKAGHWIADENPVWVANRLLRFFGEDSGVASVDLSWLNDRVTLY